MNVSMIDMTQLLVSTPPSQSASKSLNCFDTRQTCLIIITEKDSTSQSTCWLRWEYFMDEREMELSSVLRLWIINRQLIFQR